MWRKLCCSSFETMLARVTLTVSCQSAFRFSFPLCFSISLCSPITSPRSHCLRLLWGLRNTHSHGLVFSDWLTVSQGSFLFVSPCFVFLSSCVCPYFLAFMLQFSYSHLSSPSPYSPSILFLHSFHCESLFVSMPSLLFPSSSFACCHFFHTFSLCVKQNKQSTLHSHCILDRSVHVLSPTSAAFLIRFPTILFFMYQSINSSCTEDAHLVSLGLLLVFLYQTSYITGSKPLVSLSMCVLSYCLIAWRHCVSFIFA